MSRFLSFSLIVLTMSGINAFADEKENINYMPEIHGAIRSRYEMDTKSGDARFQVRNARVSLTGQVAPIIHYFVQIDACDRGKMKFLDAWGRFDLTREFKIQAGQFREPFGVDNFRAPNNYIFANRSFLGKDVDNVRGVGMKAGYYGTENLPLTVEAGVFNSSSISDHEVWSKKPTFATKVSYRLGDFKLTTGFHSRRPENVRMNLFDAAVGYYGGRWVVEGEYMNCHYTNGTAPTCHSYVVFADRWFPVKLGVFNRASVQARVDGMTNHSTGMADDEGKLQIDDPLRNRITVGGTLTYAYKWLRADVRLNFEKYFYGKSTEVAVGDGDKVLAELVIKF